MPSTKQRHVQGDGDAVVIGLEVEHKGSNVAD
jgi:hypothetical protein